jgi:integrase
MLALRRVSMSSRRYQKGQLIEEKDRWLARYREDVIQGGELKRVRRTEVLASKKECPTKRLAQRKLDDLLRDINREDYKPTVAETFGGFADKWMTTVMIHHKPSAQSSERSVINVHLKPAFDDVPLRDITAELLQAWVSGHEAAPKTVKNIITTLKIMWKQARAWGYVHTDPFEGLRLPTVQKGTGAYTFTLEETIAIINAAQGWKKLFFRVLAETGIRPGELAGLRREDVGTRAISVCQSVWQRQVQTPKTQNSVRAFAISTRLAEDLQKHIDASKPNSYGLVFASETGRPLSMDNFRHRTLNPILDKLGIRAKVEALGVRCGNYAFRHMNGTVMDGLKTPLKTRQKRLGHADINTTLTHYTDALDADDVAVADQIDALLSPTQEGDRVQ